MKRIFLLLLSASVASVSCSGGGSSSVGKPGTKGELIPREKTKSFVAERPYGMVAIPAGSFVAGLADQDPTNTPEKASLKTVTVSSFFMDEAETTNAEYRVFINYVRDSIARTLLAEAAGEGGDEGGRRGASIGDYAYLAKKEENLTPYQEYMEGQGGREDGTYDASKRLDWKIPLHWSTTKYPDVEYAEVLESMYLPASSRIGNERILDVSKLKYTYRWGDMDAALADNERGANYLKSQSIAIYPDTTVWVKDFHFAYNEPLFEQYFWHKAYKNYPVVGVTWDQARAYCNFRSKLKTDYNESLKRKKQRPLQFRLPTEIEWEYAARGGMQNATYPWGGPYLMDDRGCYLANFKPKRGNYMEDEKKGTYTYTAPVKKFKKNGFGLFDMAGNVSEWTESAYNNSSYGFSSTLNPSTKDKKDTKKSVRGGSWKDIGYALMTGARDWERKDSARSYIGFRTVQDIPEAAVKPRRVNR
ncbi:MULTISPECIES: T9SS ring complex lipoprotein PorK/GldK [Chryseobacterium]|uniref:Gliding motility-associated lipoprotein GldK n=1 Tax=Chryseobacterium jejuense TaxID=445960 RepID=A0A2X2WIX2_CHRJE|nr:MULTISPECIES: gliding motility lipoprotein GldK [Chryseobacterium]MBP2618879.1 gliding motility-associated lipoprotein GldK [Chryseobacterium jejuense]SDJ64254.1 gliding motility-associated lipoprotein GldK [Chryseobacterium jejuense]SQB43332.1 Serine/threonine-protein kinase pkn1 [Chryseobacterium jejuense]